MPADTAHSATEIDGQLRRGLPLIGNEEEEPGLTVGGEGAVGVLADLIGDVEEHAGDIVGLTGRGAPGAEVWFS